MSDITHASASAAILAHVEEGRLVQGDWHRREDGRDLACLLGAIHRSVTSPDECNGDLMPMWLAELVPVLFDGLPSDRIYVQGRRFGELIAHTLRSGQWDAIEVRFKIKIIDDAVAAARPACEGKPYWPEIASAAEQVRKALNGDGSLAAAEAVARAAAWAAEAVAGAAWAAGAVAEAEEAAEAVAWTVAKAAGAAAWAAADDRLFTFLLDQIEAEIG